MPGWARARDAFAPLIGRSFGYRKTLVYSPGGGVHKLFYSADQRGVAPLSLAIRRELLSTLDPPEENIARVNAFRPDVIEGQGSYLALLFLHLKRTGLPFYRPRVLCYSADAMPDSAREMIEREFNLPVFSLYGAMEAESLAFECQEHTGLHVNVDLCPVRIVDAEGRSLPPGASGEVVVSNLIDTGTVLLNYCLGDVAALLPEACPCGRTLPLMSQIEARGDDWVEAPDGHIVHPVAIVGPLNSPEHVWQWQVVQESAVDYRLLLVVDDAFDRHVAGAQLEQALSTPLGATAIVRVEYVAPDGLQRTAAGKTPRVISLRRRLAWEAA